MQLKDSRQTRILRVQHIAERQEEDYIMRYDEGSKSTVKVTVPGFVPSMKMFDINRVPLSDFTTIVQHWLAKNEFDEEETMQYSVALSVLARWVRTCGKFLSETKYKTARPLRGAAHAHEEDPEEI